MFSSPTIKDVARAAGVHFTTVSMALRGHPSIPAVTRDRIVAVAGRIGYRRDEVFSALSNRRSRGSTVRYRPRIAYVANRSPEDGFFDRSHNRALVEGARKQAEALGYQFELLFVDRGHHDSQSLYRHLKKEGITGVIIGAFEPARSTFELNWSEFCVVKVDSRHMPPLVTFVSTDQLNGVRLALQRMRELGYRRIGMAVGSEDEEGTDDMHLSGYLLDQARPPSGAPVPPLLFPRGADQSVVVPLLREWIAAHRVDSVICNWTNIRTMLSLAGYRCPDEVACACLSLSRRAPTLAGVVSNMGLVGQRVAALLATLMRAERRGVPELATTTLVNGIWHDGSSAPART